MSSLKLPIFGKQNEPHPTCRPRSVFPLYSLGAWDPVSRLSSRLSFPCLPRPFLPLPFELRIHGLWPEAGQPRTCVTFSIGLVFFFRALSASSFSSEIRLWYRSLLQIRASVHPLGYFTLGACAYCLGRCISVPCISQEWCVANGLWESISSDRVDGDLHAFPKMAGVFPPEMGASLDAVAKECEGEMDRLVKFFNEDPELLIVPRHGKESSTTANIVQRKRVAAHMEDSKHPFSVLVKEIVERLGSQGDQVTLASARTLVLEIGLRVCFGISNTDADPLEDNTAASLRRWEVRELKLLPPGCREEISERRRRRRKIMERLATLSSVIELLRAPIQNGGSHDAVLKAREILAKTDNEAALRAAKLDWLLKKSSSVPTQHPDVTLAVSVSDSTNVNLDSSKKRRRSDTDEREKQKQEKLLKRQRIEEQKEQKRREKEEAEREKEAEKELKRKEKEEAEKKRQEKEAEKEQRRREKEDLERKKQEKEAEKEQKRKEKEDAERRKEMALKKQASFMDRFLQASKKDPKQQGSQESNDSSAKGPTHVIEAECKVHTASVRESEPNDVVSIMDMIFQKNEEYDLDDLRREHISSWRKIRHQMSSVRPVGWGSRRKPKIYVVRELRLHGTSSSPDVAMKKTSTLDSPPKRARLEPEADGFEDVDWKESLTDAWPSTPSCEAKKRTSDRYLQLRNKRKKLLQFDKSHRPPYYGTYSKRSDVIKPRNPLKQDPTLDYDVDSDEEWEEDEPGESLSDFENERDEEEERVENEEDEDSSDEFMVPDGYLSEDEGVHLESGTTETGGSGVSEHSPSVGQSGCDIAPDGMSPEQLHRILDKATEHALRTNRPLIINNLGWDSEEGNSAVNPPTRTEVLILEALRMQVLTPTTIGVS